MAKILIKNAEIITAKDTDKYYIGILDDTIQVCLLYTSDAADD